MVQASGRYRACDSGATEKPYGGAGWAGLQHCLLQVVESRENTTSHQGVDSSSFSFSSSSSIKNIELEP